MNGQTHREHTVEETVDEVDTVPPGSAEAVLQSMQGIVGRKWHPVILYHLLRDGQTGYTELQDRIDGISSKMLSESLSELEDRELVDRTITNRKPVRVAYEPTGRGRALEPVVTELIRWGRRHLDPEEIHP